MRFVNRNREKERLLKAIGRETASFIVVYGRRRCGKSRLIREILKNSDLYFMADQSEPVRQREFLSAVVATQIKGFDEVLYPNWTALFNAINSRIAERVTICLDEFPYLVKNSPELPSVLQKLLENREELRFNLILCGSSQQLMHGLTLDSTSPLFGRADEILKIQPMQIAHLQEVLNCTAIEAVEEYSIWGGVPRYWELRISEKDRTAALMYHLFDSQGILYDEPIRLFMDDMRDTVQSFSILSLIATGSHRMSEIAARLGKPASSLSGPIEKLLSMGYIDREIPYGENYKNSKKSIYKIADPFLDFYFHFVVPNRSFIEFSHAGQIQEQIKKGMTQYASTHWERLCRQAVPFLDITGNRFLPASRWWGSVKGQSGSLPFEIDVVAESIDRETILVGECKWNEQPVHSKKLMEELLEKASMLPITQNKRIVPVLFLKRRHGNKENTIFTPDIIVSSLCH